VSIIVKRPPKYAAGPFQTEAEARREAFRENERHGGPGFFVENRDGYVDTTPHAYVPEETTAGRWHLVLTRMPNL
jgi:hypothetical protein